MRLRRYRDRGVVAIGAIMEAIGAIMEAIEAIVKEAIEAIVKIEAIKTILGLYSKRAGLCCAHSLALFSV